jgi:serine/threonine-protein kinase
VAAADTCYKPNLGEANAVAADPLIGSVLGNCEIRSRVGQGGMGVVYLAEHQVIHDRRAVKVLNATLAGQESAREDFYNEVRLPAALDHPNILIVHDAGETDLGVLYLVMPYVRGADLQVLIDRGGSLGIDETVSILSAVADALDEAHEAGLIHRDVKPANVLVGELAGGRRKRRAVYLSDFGLMKAVDRAERASGTSTGMIVGTPAYMAPEVWRAEKGIGDAIDEYALACTLFDALTGQPPYTLPTIESMMTAHISGDIPSASERQPSLPSEMDAVLARGLAKVPEDRFETCSALVDAVASTVGATPPEKDDTLDPLLRQRTVVQIETVAIERGGPEPKHNWRKVALAVGGALVVAVILAWLLRPNDEALEPVDRLPGKPLKAARDDADGSALVAVERAAGGAVVFRIQPGSLERTRVATVDDPPVHLLVDGSTTWILTSHSGIGTLVRVQGDGSEPDTVNLGGTPLEMAQTTDEIWVTIPFRDQIKVIDKTDLTTREIEDVKGPRFITPASGAVLVAGEEGGSSINVATGQVTGPQPIDGIASDIATAGGDGWLVTQGGQVGRVDVEEGDAGEIVPVTDIGGEPLRIAPATNPPAVWIPVKGAARVVRINTLTFASVTIPLPDPVKLISTAGDPVVVVTTAGDVLRIDASGLVREPEHAEGTLGPMVPLGGDVLLFAADGSVYLLARS